MMTSPENNNTPNPIEEYLRLAADTFHAPAPESVAEASGLAAAWQVYTLKDAYAERPPWEYLVDGLLQFPALAAIYGAPGSLKSMILADMMACVVAGRRWLAPLPADNVLPGLTFGVTQGPALWIDFDNGRNRTHERIEAVARAHELPEDAPLHYVSMPQPWLDASNSAMVDSLSEMIKTMGARLVAIDNLGLISGDVEENSSEMARVMGNLRRLSDDSGAAIIIIHHQRKGSSNDTNTRAGDKLRGHSSIEAALDLAMLIDRKGISPNVNVSLTKVRGYSPVDRFGAMFAFDHKPNGRDLAAARFFSQSTMTPAELENYTVRETIKVVLRKEKRLMMKDLVTAVRDHQAAQPGGKAAGINKVRGIAKDMLEAGELENVSDDPKSVVLTLV